MENEIGFSFVRKKFTEFKKTNNKEEDGVSDGDDVSVDVDVDVDDDDVKEEERKFELCKNDCVFFFSSLLRNSTNFCFLYFDLSYYELVLLNHNIFNKNT